MNAEVFSLSSYAPSSFALPTFVTACAVLGLGVWVLVRERAVVVSRLFFLVTLPISIWLFAFTLMYCARSEAVALWWAKAAYLGIPMIPSGIFHFAVVCLGLNAVHGRWVRVSWLLSAFFMIAILGTDELVGGLYRYWWGYYPQYGWLSGPYLSFFFGMMVVSLRLFWMEYRKSRPGTIPARRVRGFLVAFGIAYLGSVDYLAKYGLAVYPFGYLPIAVFLVLSARLIRRYPLADLAPQFAESQILALLQDALVVCDIHGTIRVANHAACRLLGYEERELVGRPLDALVENTAEARGRLHAMLQHLPSRDEEMRWRTRDGRPLEVALSTAALIDARQLPAGTIVLARDVRARKVSEQRLNALASFPESNPSAVLEATPGGDVVYANPASKQLFPELETMGRDHPLLHALGAVGSILERQQSQTMVRETKVGDAVYEEHIHRVPGSNVLRLYVIDVTDRKKYEQSVERQSRELQRANQELRNREQLMRSLLEDLQQSRERMETQGRALEAANTRLKELASIKDDLVAKVSHELRTPLTSIKEGLSLLIDNALGQTTADQQDFLKTMDEDVDRLTELITHLLDLSKIEAGRMRLMRTRLDLRDTVQALLTTYQPILRDRTIRTELGDVPPVFADRNRMIQILSNLVSNAIKFTPERGTITLRLESHDSTVNLSVEDSGSGIAPDDLPKLFEKFSQVGSSERSQMKGTGLGLVVCKELTELHRGRIEVASEVGRGTTFSVKLPAYSDRFALSESLREIVEQTTSDEGECAGIILIDSGPLLAGQAWPARQAALEQLAASVRNRVHREDIVLPLEGACVMVLAAAPPAGLQSIIHRLRQTIPEIAPLRIGTAIYPQHGQDAEVLLTHAQRALRASAQHTVEFKGGSS